MVAIGQLHERRTTEESHLSEERKVAPKGTIEEAAKEVIKRTLSPNSETFVRRARQTSGE